MKRIHIPLLNREVAPIAMGTWVLGGCFKGGINENEAVKTIHLALDRGINFIDTAPLYGFGKTEEFVGKALKQYGKRDEIVLATKCGLSWKDQTIYRDARKKIVLSEIEASLRRLNVDYVDLYQVHWPDPLTPVSETVEALQKVLKEGKIRAVGLSNFNMPEFEAFQREMPVQALQSPFNLFERGIVEKELAFDFQNKIPLLGYSALCRGMLSGHMKKESKFRDDDLRSVDPKFCEPLYSQYLRSAECLRKWALRKHQRSLHELGIRWVLDKGAIALWGPKSPDQVIDIASIEQWKLDKTDFEEIEKIISETVKDPIGPEFLAPPARETNFI